MPPRPRRDRQTARRSGPRLARTSAQATNELHSAWEKRDWCRQIVGRGHWRGDSALVHRHDRRTQGVASERPVPDQYLPRQTVSKEGTGAPERRTPKGTRAAHRKSISQHPANDEQERTQPITPNKPGLSGSSGFSGLFSSSSWSCLTKQTRQTK